MINIIKGVLNTLTLTLNESVTIPSPHFIFRFTESSYRVTIKELTDTSLFPTRYNEFTFIEGTDVSIYASGNYEVFESAIGGDVLIGGEKLLESGLFQINKTLTQGAVFDPVVTNATFNPSAPYSVVYEPTVSFKGPQGATGPTGPQGSTGAGLSILGSYTTYADLVLAHPTGNLGDGYLVSGDLYVWSVTFWDNVGNVQGPQGATGATGSQGPIGLTGADSTVAGPQGFQGARGYQGFTGADSTIAGPTGPQGPQGFTGAVGADSTVAGPQGFQGSIGQTGPQGAQGFTGADSIVAGPQGYQGPQGFTGATGADSTVAGPQGFQGATGPAGPQGSTGSQGPQGYQGATGLTGDTGPQGFQGATGDTGAQGPQGYQGATGADSTVAGPQGTQGSQGAQGAQGYQGAMGTQGYTGAPGESAGQIYYMHHPTVTDPAGYEGLERIPANSAQVDESVLANSGTGNVLIDKYITLIGDPGTTTIKAGIWYFDMFHYIDSAVGVTKFVYEVYKRIAAGTETLLFSVTSDEINATTVTLFETTYTQSADIALLTDDRIVVYIYAQSTSAANRNCHLVYEGNINASHIHSPIGIAGVTGPQGPQGAQGATGADSTVAGPQGAVGAQGPQGFQGATGADGTNGVTFGYVDGSLGARDTSINYLNTNKVNIAPTFNLQSTTYSATATDFNNVIEASGTFTLTFPNTLATGFSSTVVNVGNGVITLAGDTVYATDSSVALRDKYAAASVVHKGGGVYYFMGNLK